MKKTFSRLRHKAGKRMPTVLAVAAVGGVALTAYSAVKCYQKSEEKKEELKKTNPNPTKIEVAKATWTSWVPVGIVMAGTTAAILQSDHMHRRTIAGLTTAAALTQSDMVAWKSTAKDIIGEEKVQEIEQKKIEKQAQEMAETERPTYGDVPVISGDQILVYEASCNHWFKTTVTDLHMAELNLNSIYIENGFATLADFYRMLGVHIPDVAYLKGWYMDDDYYPNFIHVMHTSGISANGRPCLILNWVAIPELLDDKI